MPLTLSTAKASLEEHLADLSNLVWSDTALEEALRAALAELANAYGSALSLDGLDGATSTTLEDLDAQVLVTGGAAYAARFRVMGRYEEATPEDRQNEPMAKWAAETMAKFQSDLIRVRVRKFQDSTDCPYSPWDWAEGRDFL
jgi:hypothetical protein